MRRALDLARRAAEEGEVPVGAVVARDNRILGEGWNQSIAAQDPTAHAELLAIRQAAQALGNYRLTGCTLYTTLEPCAMCAGAMVWARVERVVMAAKDPKAGAAGSVLTVIPHPALNHRPLVEFGPGEEEACTLLQEFFRDKRKKATC